MKGNAIGDKTETDRGFDELAGEVGMGAELLESGQSAPKPSVKSLKNTLEPGLPAKSCPDQ